MLETRRPWWETVLGGVAADGSFGVVIAEVDDATKEYRNNLNYTEYMDFDTKVILTIDDALPHVIDALGVE